MGVGFVGGCWPGRSAGLGGDQSTGRANVLRRPGPNDRRCSYANSLYFCRNIPRSRGLSRPSRPPRSFHRVGTIGEAGHHRRPRATRPGGRASASARAQPPGRPRESARGAAARPQTALRRALGAGATADGGLDGADGRTAAGPRCSFPTRPRPGGWKPPRTRSTPASANSIAGPARCIAPSCGRGDIERVLAGRGADSDRHLHPMWGTERERPSPGGASPPAAKRITIALWVSLAGRGWVGFGRR